VFTLAHTSVGDGTCALRVRDEFGSRSVLTVAATELRAVRQHVRSTVVERERLLIAFIRHSPDGRGEGPCRTVHSPPGSHLASDFGLRKHRFERRRQPTRSATAGRRSRGTSCTTAGSTSPRSSVPEGRRAGRRAGRTDRTQEGQIPPSCRLSAALVALIMQRARGARVARESVGAYLGSAASSRAPCGASRLPESDHRFRYAPTAASSTCGTPVSSAPSRR
jgi:hypothetical protein